MSGWARASRGAGFHRCHHTRKSGPEEAFPAKRTPTWVVYQFDVGAVPQLAGSPQKTKLTHYRNGWQIESAGGSLEGRREA